MQVLYWQGRTPFPIFHTVVDDFGDEVTSADVLGAVLDSGVMMHIIHETYRTD